LAKNDELFEENFAVIEEYIKFTAGHIKKLTIKDCFVDQKILLKLLNMLPDLTTLELEEVAAVNEEDLEWTWKPTKLEIIQMEYCDSDIESLLESLSECTIKEANLRPRGNRNNFINFLKVQEKNIKKLTVVGSIHLLDGLKEMRLEYLDLICAFSEIYSLEILRQLPDLKVLKLYAIKFIPENSDMIYELKNLEELQLRSVFISFGMNEGLNRVHQLEKLKRLEVCRDMCFNIFDNLRFGVHNSLEELDANLYGLDQLGALEMNRLVPNLRKLRMSTNSSNIVNWILESMQNLESLTVDNDACVWKIPNGSIFPKIKHLDVDDKFKFNARKLAKAFPNLESLKIEYSASKIKKSTLVALLTELKQLEELELSTHTGKVALTHEFVVQTVQNYGKKLKKILVGYHINAGFCERGICTDSNVFAATKSNEIPGVEIVTKISA
jgi:hypothetical protein